MRCLRHQAALVRSDLEDIGLADTDLVGIDPAGTVQADIVPEDTGQEGIEQ